MNTITVSATDFKNNFSDILGMVTYSKKKVTVSKHGRIVATLIPETKVEKKFDKNIATDAEIEAKLAEYYGAIPDMMSYEEIRKSRYFRDRDIDL